MSQMDESKELNNAFPDALKEPILRRVQFSTVSRIDNLGKSAISPTVHFQALTDLISG